MPESRDLLNWTSKDNPTYTTQICNRYTCKTFSDPNRKTNIYLIHWYGGKNTIHLLIIIFYYFVLYVYLVRMHQILI